jgi:hypothetical protein
VKVSVLVTSLSFAVGVGWALSNAGVVAAANPTFDPSNFSGHAVHNPWFPLVPGTTLVYKGVKDGKKGTDIVHVTKRTRVVDGVLATVVEDTTTLNGRLSEHTLDWYAQDDAGNVWYVGERTAEYNRYGEVISREGSWEAGVNGALPGVFMPAHPHVGDSYRQEFLPGEAEDHFEITNLDATVTVPYATYTGAMRTKEWTPLEPGVRDAKFYAIGVGEVEEKTVIGPTEVFKLVQIVTSPL